MKWLGEASDLTPESVVTVTDDLLVAIAERAEGRGAAGATRLVLREEVINPEAATVLGGRSIQLDLDLDCPGHRVIVGARRIYERPNLQGSVRVTRSDNAWVPAPADTVIDEVMRAACSPHPPAPLIAAEPVPASAPRALDIPAASAAVAQAQPVSPPAPAPELRKVAAAPPATLHEPPVGGVVPERAPAPRPAPAARSAPVVAPPRPADFAVQIASADSADQAHDIWRSLRARLPDLIGPRTFAVEPVPGQGRTQYRALLLGFASQTEAVALCRTLRGRSVDCVLRQMK